MYENLKKTSRQKVNCVSSGFQAWVQSRHGPNTCATLCTAAQASISIFGWNKVAASLDLHPRST